ncbi:hypothetical protein [Amycolatopsis kentuckyensis]|uniref:hypothetical protein n=1 Tax=Amycolatopsis kentuckyensis TaxID=218823 RepID=UPI000A3A3CD5|nr:hypothetical protein [Amycolatopsis kentuckyensis]
MKRILAIAAAAAAIWWLAVKVLQQIDRADRSPLDDRLDEIQPFWLDADDQAYREAVERGG